MGTRAIGTSSLMRCWRVLSGLRRCRNGRPDKAFTPHPAIGTPCLMRCWRILSGLQSVLER
ncbi:hypothetical protein DMH88_09535 [Escherichia coli]|nr:hypothetical protein [Escherichia coli]